MAKCPYCQLKFEKPANKDGVVNKKESLFRKPKYCPHCKESLRISPYYLGCYLLATTLMIISYFVPRAFYSLTEYPINTLFMLGLFLALCLLVIEPYNKAIKRDC